MQLVCLSRWKVVSNQGEVLHRGFRVGLRAELRNADRGSVKNLC